MKGVKMNVLKSVLILLVVTVIANAAENWVTIPNDKILSLGRVVGTSFGFKTDGGIGIDVKDNITWPGNFSTANSATHYGTTISFCGQINQAEANKQILAILMAAVASGKGLALYIREDDGTSQLSGRPIILCALLVN
jgi:hypothetical protein